MNYEKFQHKIDLYNVIKACQREIDNWQHIIDDPRDFFRITSYNTLTGSREYNPKGDTVRLIAIAEVKRLKEYITELDKVFNEDLNQNS